eukprot:752336-Hanusia_phi.AAC.3
MRALPDDLLEPLPVEARERVLSRVQAPGPVRRPPRVLHQVHGSGAGPVGQVLVLHLQAREVEHYPVLGEHLSDRLVTVSVARVEVPGRQLRRMALSLAPPVDPRDLGRQQDVGALEGPPRPRQHFVAVPEERVGVPLEEKRACLRLPQPVVLEELRVFGRVVVVAHLICMRRPGQTPLGLLRPDRGPDQVPPHVLVVALELADARKVPEGKRVGRVPELPSRPKADLSLDDDVGDELSEGGSEAMHEVLVHVERGPPVEDLLLVGSKRDVLPVAIQRHVRVEDVGIEVSNLQHPLG